MLRDNTVSGDRGGLREAVPLARAWGIDESYITNTIIEGAYDFMGMEEWISVAEAVGDVLRTRLERNVFLRKMCVSRKELGPKGTAGQS